MCSFTLLSCNCMDEMCNCTPRSCNCTDKLCSFTLCSCDCTDEMCSFTPRPCSFTDKLCSFTLCPCNCTDELCGRWNCPFWSKNRKNRWFLPKSGFLTTFGREKTGPARRNVRKGGAAARVGRVGGDVFFSHGLNTDETRILLTRISRINANYFGNADHSLGGMMNSIQKVI